MKPHAEPNERNESTTSEEVIRKKLGKKPDFNGTTRALFGSENLQTLSTLLCEGPFLDIDVLVKIGTLNKDEAGQYMKLLPEYAVEVEKTYAVITRIATHTHTTLARRVRSIDKVVPEQESVLWVINQVKSIWDAFAINYQERRMWQLHHLLECLVGNILLFLDQEATTHNKQPQIQALFKWINDQSKKHCGEAYYGMDFLYNAYLPAQRLFSPASSYQKTFEREITNVTYTHRQELKTEIESMLKQIHPLRRYRRILANTHTFQDVRIFIHKDDLLSEIHGNPNICFVDLALDPDIKLTLPQRTELRGKVIYTTKTHPALVQLTMNSSGELLFLDNHTVSLRKILTEDQYQALQYQVLKQVYEYLQQKDPDIPDLFAAATISDTEKCRETITAILTEDNTVLEPTTINAAEQETLEHSEQIALPIENSPTIKSPHQPTQSVINKNHTQTIPRSLKSFQVMRTLTALLGKPRCSGSHFVFTGKNGQNFPIPLHNGTDVNPHILRTCLAKWALSPEEFIAAL